MDLSLFPRIRLGHFPTPLEPMGNLSELLGGPRLWVKRDDCTGLSTGGNKTRKLEYLMAEAVAARANVVVTQGATQSNHARQTAAAAARLGMKCHILLEDRTGSTDPDYTDNGNVLLDRLHGATVERRPGGADMQREMEQVAEKLRADGLRPYVIPGGGSNPVGALGFGAVCGSSMVGSLTIGGVALPEMTKLGYNKRLSSGVLAAGGTLSVLIPPSLILLFYGIVTDTSIGELFIAGVIPGLLLTFLFAVVVFVWGRMYPSHIPGADNTPRPTVTEFLIAFGPIFLIGLVITVSIYAGIATPTEAAAVSALLTTILAFAVGGLTLRGFNEALFATMRTMGYLGLLLSAGILFGFVLTYYRVPQEVSELFLSYNLSPVMVLTMVIVFYVILGMFLEPVSMTFITLPTIFPLMQAAGYDLIWFGIVYTITMEIAVLTPPVGLNLYVIQGISRGTIPIGDVIKGCLPFLACMVLLIAMVIAIPGIALWLAEDGVDATARRISATWLLHREQSPHASVLGDLATQASAQAAEAGLWAMERWDGRPNLPHITQSTLIVWGDQDRSYQWPQVEQLWQQIPNASLAVLPHCSHALHLEYPELFHRLVADFLLGPANQPM